MSYPQLLKSWQQLNILAQQTISATEPQNANLKCQTEQINLDYSGQRVNQAILDTLFELAAESNLQEQIEALFKGFAINNTESRPALHTALRATSDDVIHVNSRNVVADVIETRQRMKLISNSLRHGEWLGNTRKAITDVVNLGIGGSMLGPLFCIKALSDYVIDSLNFHFVSEMDPQSFARVCQKLNPETTLFIVSSKSFTTPETLFNLQKALHWLKIKEPSAEHFIAVTSNISEAESLGFKTILPIWDWVGGRFSLCSAINLITCIAIGYEQFSKMLAGAHQMDEHFRSSNFEHNLPVILALLGIWNINFLDCNNLLVLTYSDDLHFFVPYLQQLDMESNGKSVNKQSEIINYNTGPIIWGGAGNQAQHSYYQSLCQGTQKTAVDLISLQTFNDEPINQICLDHRKVITHGVMNTAQNQQIRGNIPVNHLSIVDSSPKSIGALVALYEHKIFVQGTIWNINSFDQPGVETAKKNFSLTTSSDSAKLKNL